MLLAGSVNEQAILVNNSQLLSEEYSDICEIH